MSDGHAGLGRAYEYLSQYENAIAAFREAIRLKPNDADYYDGLGGVYLDLGRYPDAVQAYKQATRLKPGTGRDWVHAEFFLSEGDDALDKKAYDKALEAYGSVLLLGPERAEEAHERIGETYYAMGQYQKAVPPLREALRLKPDYHPASNLLGLAYLYLKQYPNAVAAFQQTIRLKPDEAMYHYHLGLTYLAMGLKNDALRVYRTLLRIDKAKAQELYAEINKART